MTWNWTLTKMGIGFSLGAISSHPVGWAIGLSTSQLIKLKNQENLNSSTLTLSDKETAQRWIEVANDYQAGAGLGIASKNLGTLVSEILNERTLNIGKEAEKEIAVHGFKTEFVKELISEGQFISKIEKVIKLIPKIKEVKDGIEDTLDLIKEIGETNNEIEFVKNISSLIKLQSLIVDKIEINLSENKNLLNNVKKNTLKLNKKNVKFFIRYEKIKEGHRLINHEINKILTRIKAIQLDLHNNNDCCESCRFCL